MQTPGMYFSGGCYQLFLTTIAKFQVNSGALWSFYQIDARSVINDKAPTKVVVKVALITHEQKKNHFYWGGDTCK